jgi:hypothetical protein
MSYRINRLEFESRAFKVPDVLSAGLRALALELVGGLPDHTNEISTTHCFDYAVAAHNKEIISHQIYPMDSNLMSPLLDLKGRGFWA